MGIWSPGRSFTDRTNPGPAELSAHHKEVLKSPVFSETVGAGQTAATTLHSTQLQQRASILLLRRYQPDSQTALRSAFNLAKTHSKTSLRSDEIPGHL